MPQTIVFEGKTSRQSVLDDEGNADASLDPKLDKPFLSKLYKQMVLCRKFDQKAIALQRQGRSFTYTPFEGQEAVQVIAGMLLDPKDWAFPSYRESAFYITRGAPMSQLFIYLRGHEDGMALPGATNDFPMAIPVGSQTAHAPGAAYALKLAGGNNVSVCFFGDGASSQGDSHESMNFAGIYKLPVIFICTNNQWAISTPRKIQTAGQTLAQRALSYGFEGVQVDGMDPLAFYNVFKAALEKARNGGGPTLIEAVCYRFGPHSTADDPKKYRSDEEVAQWRKQDWPTRFGEYLKKQGILDDSFAKQAEDEAIAAVEAAVAEADKFTDSPTQMFDYVYSTPTTDLQKEKLEFKDFYGK
jgi:pyruvate dehydrogenase E1 component alpha subunit